MSLIRYPIKQYAYVVQDLEAACMAWVQSIGAGPFFVSHHHVSEAHTYRGEPNRADLSYAFGQSGPDHHIQLIQQHNDAPSVYRDAVAAGSNGFHHFAVLPDDFDGEVARFEAAGYPAVSTLVSAARVAYMDCRSTLGCFVELYENNQPLLDTFERWRQAHLAWDGKTDPIRA